MTYKVYMTIELPERYASKEDAMDAAVKELQDAVQRQVEMPAIEFRASSAGCSRRARSPMAAIMISLSTSTTGRSDHGHPALHHQRPDVQASLPRQLVEGEAAHPA